MVWLFFLFLAVLGVSEFFKCSEDDVVIDVRGPRKIAYPEMADMKELAV